jgi:glycosyltransferase involved in cell wall biosynthesis
VAPGDTGELSEALRAWLTDAGLRERWRAAARARRNTLHGWDHTTRRVSEVLGQ